jgi:hypothetical protein
MLSRLALISAAFPDFTADELLRAINARTHPVLLPGQPELQSSQIAPIASGHEPSVKQPVERTTRVVTSGTIAGYRSQPSA